MTERPILFSGPMVKAILDGRKTQTRRVLKPQPSSVDGSGCWYRMPSGGESLNCYSLPYVVGDVLYVRETWAPIPGRTAITYRAGNVVLNHGLFIDLDAWLGGWPEKWRPSIHMPKWAARIWLEVTNVRVQRVQEIDGLDALAEGITRVEGEAPWRTYNHLWDSLNKKRGYGWDANPWVAAYTFKRIEKPS